MTENLESLKVDIKRQPGDKDSETAEIYVPMFRTGSTEANLKFVKILKISSMERTCPWEPRSISFHQHLSIKKRNTYTGGSKILAKRRYKI